MDKIKKQIQKVEDEMVALMLELDDALIGSEDERDSLAQDGDDYIHYASMLIENRCSRSRFREHK